MLFCFNYLPMYGVQIALGIFLLHREFREALGWDLRIFKNSLTHSNLKT